MARLPDGTSIGNAIIPWRVISRRLVVSAAGTRGSSPFLRAAVLFIVSVRASMGWMASVYWSRLVSSSGRRPSRN